MRLQHVLALLGLLLLSTVAYAQVSVTNVDQPAPGGANVSPGSDTAPPASFLGGSGIPIGDALVLHPNFALSTGYDTNVFYQNSTDGPDGPEGSALMRFNLGAILGNGPRSPTDTDEPPRIGVNLVANFIWNQYLNSDESIRTQSDLGIGAVGRVQFNAGTTGAFYVQDGFTRAIQPPPEPAQADLNQDKNVVTVGGTFAPGGGAIQGYANYQFAIDFFERSALDFANRMSHLFTVGAKWQWLPKTQISVETSLGITTPSDTTLKSGSFPFRIQAGIATLFTPTIGTLLTAGYGNGFYTSGPNYSSYLLSAELRWAPLAVVHTAIGYSHTFDDSVVANFFVDDQVYARVATQIFSKLIITGTSGLIFRNYEGIRDIDGFQYCGDAACDRKRNDILFHLDLSANYPIKDYLLVGISYSLFSDTTDFFVRDPATGLVDSGGFVWQEILANAAAKF